MPNSPTTTISNTTFGPTAAATTPIVRLLLLLLPLQVYDVARNARTRKIQITRTRTTIILNMALLFAEMIQINYEISADLYPTLFTSYFAAGSAASLSWRGTLKSSSVVPDMTSLKRMLTCRESVMAPYQRSPSSDLPHVSTEIVSFATPKETAVPVADQRQ